MTLVDYDILMIQLLPDTVNGCIVLLEAIKTSMQSDAIGFAHLSQFNDRAQLIVSHAKTLLYHQQHGHGS